MNIEDKIIKGIKIKEEIDNLSGKLNKIKEDIIEYHNKTGKKKIFANNIEYVTISKTNTFNKIDPVETFELMNKYGKDDNFIEVVSILVGELKKFLGNDDILKLKGEPTGHRFTISFKKKKN